MARPGQRHVPGVFLRPRALPLRRDRQAVKGRQDDVQGHRQRRSRHRIARAAVVFRRGRQGPHRPQPLCRADRDQPRPDLRPLSEEGHDRDRQRRRYRDLGPGAACDRVERDAARQCRLYALRGPPPPRLAGDRIVARPPRRRRRPPRRRTRQRQFPPLRPLRRRQTVGPPHPQSSLSPQAKAVRR